MNKILNKYNVSLREEKNNTSLVGIIGVFIMLVSMIGNTNNSSPNFLKTSLYENKAVALSNNQENSFLDNNSLGVLSIGKQTVFINGQEFIIEITPKY
ncbi:MAG: hypothetical protein PHZ26_00530 [Candidatus Gracilibacteria bacterium]|nr:hypothetical protein [Candidatus Gracilibacteria bacterium]MDD2908223.1 hypothetical protein [Candidatus Gracilibacteria bacterium]